MEEAEEQMSDIEDKTMENNEAEKKNKRKILYHECRLREFSNSKKHNNIRIIGVPEEEREKRGEDLFEEIIADNFLYLEEETDIQIQANIKTHCI